MLILVTQDHIDKGVPGDPQACPVYWAMLDAGLPVYAVGKSQLQLARPEPDWPGYFRRVFFETPLDVRAKITTYDDDAKYMAPFEFEMREQGGMDHPDRCPIDTLAETIRYMVEEATR